LKNLLTKNRFKFLTTEDLLKLNKPFLFRMKNDKQVYLLEYGIKRAIPSSKVFEKYSFDFDDVVVIEDGDFFNLLPNGPELK
jgi:hypothetical protein